MKNKRYIQLLCYLGVFVGIIIFGIMGNRVVNAIAKNQQIVNRHQFVIDAGHGGIDGGTVSCTGIHESKINLEIATRLNDLIHLLGYNTVMIRTEDKSIHTSGESIASIKASDLKERVRIVNETPNAILLSIHQNHYHDSYYKGAQMFYSENPGSEELARQLQAGFIHTLNPGSYRQAKKSEGIYLMKHIQTTGVLVECGFLSNFEEEAMLKESQYQKQVCCVIAAVCANFLQLNNIT